MESNTSSPVLEIPRARRLHPMSLVFEIGDIIRRQFIPIVFGLITVASLGEGGAWVGLGVLGFSVVFVVIRYATFQYRIEAGELVVDQGLIFHTHRTIPISRIQNIDLLQTLIHRWFGVAEVRIETASGEEPEAIFRVLGLRDVDELRALLGQVSTHGVSTTSLVVESLAVDDSSVDLWEYKIGAKELILAGIANNRGMILLAVLFGASYQFNVWKVFDFDVVEAWIENRAIQTSSWILVCIALITVVLGALLLRVLSSCWYLVRFYGYQLRLRQNTFQIQCGLFTKISASVVRSRIQFVSIHRTWIARWLGIASIRVETAGGGSKEEGDTASTISRQWFLPVLTEKDVPEVLAKICPGVSWKDDDAAWCRLDANAFRRKRKLVVIASVLGSAAILFWQKYYLLVMLAVGVILYLAYLRAWIQSVRYQRTPWGIVFQSGVWTQKCSFTFFESIQWVRVEQSPFDRKWKMARLVLDTPAAGPADHEIAIELIEEDWARREASEISNKASVKGMVRTTTFVEFQGS